MQLAFGLLEMAGGTAEIAAGSAAEAPTAGLSTALIVVGSLQFMHGWDQVSTGAMNWFNPEDPARTFFEQAFLNMTGDEDSARRLDISFSMAIGIIGGASAANSTVGGSLLGGIPLGGSATDDVIVLFRGMRMREFTAVQQTLTLESKSGSDGATGLLALLRHSFSSTPGSPYVSLTGSPSVARHFIFEGMKSGSRSGIYRLLDALGDAFRDGLTRAGIRRANIAEGKVLARIRVRKSDVIQTLHFAQDEFVAINGTRILSIEAIVDPAAQSALSARVGLGAAGHTMFWSGAAVGVVVTVTDILDGNVTVHRPRW